MNKIQVNFVPCEPAPSRGYNVKWRVAGSSDELKNAGNFYVSPIVFYDRVNLAGTHYEGFIKSDCGGEANEINWSTVNGCMPCCIPTGVSASVSASAQQITGDITVSCSDNGCTNEGQIVLYIVFPASTTEDIALLFGQVMFQPAFPRFVRDGDDIMSSIPGGTIANPYYDSVIPPNGHKLPFYVFIPAGTTVFDNTLFSLYKLGHDGDPFSSWFCHSCDEPITEMWVKSGTAGYTANLTLTNETAELHNETSEDGEIGNQITVNFTPCDGITSYAVRWRVAGSSGAYTNAGVFSSSPAVFTDNANPAGTDYEGFIHAISSESGACEDVAWSTVIT